MAPRKRGTRSRVLGFGDNVIDVFLDRRVAYPGGNCVNLAVFSQRLGADAAYLGAFGSDGSERLILDALDAESVDTSRTEFRRGENSIATLRVVAGDRTFVGGNRGGVTAREPVRPTDELWSWISTFDLVHSSVYSSSEAELPELSRLPPIVTYDFSVEDEFRSSEYLHRVCPHIDLALFSCPSAGDEEVGAILDQAIALGTSAALATRGTAGSMFKTESLEVSAPAQLLDDPARLVDTTGCGDAYLAGFIATMLARDWAPRQPFNRRDVEDSLIFAANTAALQCLEEGAFGHGVPLMSNPYGIGARLGSYLKDPDAIQTTA